MLFIVRKARRKTENFHVNNYALFGARRQEDIIFNLSKTRSQNCANIFKETPDALNLLLR
ncbi:hypothetical protein HMPREF7215_0808 [Pyramidobacter piscolens W5455]|uniref:Uncharacterized protein n=1 Tax=Pyramidobacter piscolens W5455 TaxID=352165 RepID=A0ABM9ZV62_9BACT|nr:hypothetical protein HMPREF7215_0808 [Pyramidobacter piscolens W5455]